MKLFICDNIIQYVHQQNFSTISVAVSQVLLATGGGHLVYLEIGHGELLEKKHVQLEYEISCLDINPVGDDPHRSHLAAVGMWTDISVRVYSLPNLELITLQSLGGEIIPRSVLFCTFEAVSLKVETNTREKVIKLI